MSYAPEPIPTGADNVCSIVLFIPLGAMIVIGMIMLAAFRGVVPGLLKTAGNDGIHGASAGMGCGDRPDGCDAADGGHRRNVGQAEEGKEGLRARQRRAAAKKKKGK